MIVFDLMCSSGHRFEGWFASAADFGSQKARDLVSCPICGAKNVERVPSVTRFNSGAPAPQPPTGRPQGSEGKDPFAVAQMLYSRLLDDLLGKSENVGADFSAEARRIFYKESPARSIYGQASAEEHAGLVDEGIPVLRLPVPSPDRWN